MSKEHLPTSTQVTTDVVTQLAKGPGAVAIFISENASDSGKTPLTGDEKPAFQRLLQSGAATGKARQVLFDLVPSGKDFRRVFVVGMGNQKKVDAEAIRGAAGALQRAARRQKQQHVTAGVPEIPGLSIAETAAAIVTGFMLASFEFKEFKGSGNVRNDSEELTPPMAMRLSLLVEARDLAVVKSAINRALAVADAQNFCRTIASRPGNVINPPMLAKVADQAGRQVGLTVKILDEKEIKRLGMGGILAVGGGSQTTPPRIIVLEHRPPAAGKMKPLLVVGKAITFDTGGISIKPADKMGSMIYDKSGGTAVLGFMCAVAALKLPIPVVGILTSAENHISGTAYRPGDILRMYNGVTVEVTNTDAEGRLVLGDALAWGIETYQPAAVVDLATLTGACVVALGQTMAGMMANDDALADELVAAGKRAGEQMWRLPLGDDQREQIRSQHADIVNSAGRFAGVLQGGAFLSYFIPRDGSVPWVHLDIAGVADTDRELSYYGKGSVGWGVRTLVEWASNRSESMKHATGPAKRTKVVR